MLITKRDEHHIVAWAGVPSLEQEAFLPALFVGPTKEADILAREPGYEAEHLEIDPTLRPYPNRLQPFLRRGVVGLGPPPS